MNDTALVYFWGCGAIGFLLLFFGAITIKAAESPRTLVVG